MDRHDEASSRFSQFCKGGYNRIQRNRKGVEWIYVVQDRPKWQNLVKNVMKIRLPENVGTFQLSEELLASQEGLRSVPI